MLPATLYLAAINTNFSALSLVWLIPIAFIIYFDIRLVYYGIKKEGWLKPVGLIISFALSLGALVWGLWSVFTSFSMSLMFVAVGGGILFLFSLRSLTLDKDDFKHEK